MRNAAPFGSTMPTLAKSAPTTMPIRSVMMRVASRSLPAAARARPRSASAWARRPSICCSSQRRARSRVCEARSAMVLSVDVIGSVNWTGRFQLNPIAPTHVDEPSPQGQRCRCHDAGRLRIRGCAREPLDVVLTISDQDRLVGPERHRRWHVGRRVDARSTGRRRRGPTRMAAARRARRTPGHAGRS